MKNQRGQMAVEMVLLMALFVGIAIFVSSTMRSNNTISNLVSKPWRSLSGLIQNGVVGTPQDTMAKHPAAFGRVATALSKDGSNEVE